MTLLATPGRRRLDVGPPPEPPPDPPEDYPWEPIGWNTIPTSDGSGATIHPSVVDMVAENGSAWNGYRWWMINTPYPLTTDSLENPEIYCSNDGVIWETPAGLTNPIDPYPGVPEFHSDPEMAWDPDEGRMVAYWRRSNKVTGLTQLHMATSTDGSSWDLLGVSSIGGIRSPSLVRAGAGDWRMFAYGSRVSMYVSTSPLGPWTLDTSMNLGPNELTGWHGDVALIDGQWYAVNSKGATSAGSFVVLSVNIGPTIRHWATAMELPWTSYRPTITKGREPGTIDFWGGTYSGAVPGGCGTRSTTIPKSAWLDAIPPTP